MKVKSHVVQDFFDPTTIVEQPMSNCLWHSVELMSDLTHRVCFQGHIRVDVYPLKAHPNWGNHPAFKMVVHDQLDDKTLETMFALYDDGWHLMKRNGATGLMTQSDTVAIFLSYCEVCEPIATWRTYLKTQSTELWKAQAQLQDEAEKFDIELEQFDCNMKNSLREALHNG